MCSRSLLSTSLALAALMPMAAELQASPQLLASEQAQSASDKAYAPDSLDGYELILDYSEARFTDLYEVAHYDLTVSSHYKGHEQWPSVPYEKDPDDSDDKRLRFDRYCIDNGGSRETYSMTRTGPNQLALVIDSSYMTGDWLDMVIEFTSPDSGKLLIGSPNGCTHNIKFRAQINPPSSPQQEASDLSDGGGHSFLPNALILIDDRALRIQGKFAYYSKGGDYDRYTKTMPVIQFNKDFEHYDQLGQKWEEITNYFFYDFSQDSASWGAKNYAERLNTMLLSFTTRDSAREELVGSTYIDQEGKTRLSGRATITINDGIAPSSKDKIRNKPIISQGIVHGLIYKPTEDKAEDVSQATIIDYGSAGMQLPDGYESYFTQLCQHAAKTGSLAEWKALKSYVDSNPQGLHAHQRTLSPVAFSIGELLDEQNTEPYARELRKQLAARLATNNYHEQLRGGNTSLHYAAIIDNQALAEYLVDTGLPINSVNHRDQTALDCIEDKDSALARWLIERGAVEHHKYNATESSETE